MYHKLSLFKSLRKHQKVQAVITHFYQNKGPLNENEDDSTDDDDEAEDDITHIRRVTESDESEDDSDSGEE